MSEERAQGESADLVSRLIRVHAPRLGLLVLFAAAVRASLRLGNDDTFFHLRFGAEFLDGWSLSSPGSVTGFGTRDWVPTQWASQMTMAQAERWGGTPAVAWLSGALLVTFILTLYLTCRRRSASLVAVAVTAMAVLTASQGLSARPQVVSYILVVVTVGAWLTTAEDGKLRWWLVPVTWAWSTLHGMWPIAVVIGIVACIGLALDQRDPRRLIALVVPVASLVATLISPLGWQLLHEVAVVGSRGKYFDEWGPTKFTDLQPLVLAGILCVVLLIWMRTGDVAWVHGLLFLLAGGLSLYSARTVPVAAALVAPIAAVALMRLLPRPSQTDHRADQRIAWVGGGVALTVLALLLPTTLKVGPGHPDWVEQRLDSVEDDSVILNEWAWGGYLMWQHPELDFVISGYGDIYTTAELDRNVALHTTGVGWMEDLRMVDPDLAVLASDSRLAYALEETLDWKVIEEGQGVVLLAPIPKR